MFETGEDIVSMRRRMNGEKDIEYEAFSASLGVGGEEQK